MVHSTVKSNNPDVYSMHNKYVKHYNIAKQLTSIFNHLPHAQNCSQYLPQFFSHSSYFSAQMGSWDLAQNFSIKHCILFLELCQCLFSIKVHLVLVLFVKDRHGEEQYRNCQKQGKKMKLELSIQDGISIQQLTAF